MTDIVKKDSSSLNKFTNSLMTTEEQSLVLETIKTLAQGKNLKVENHSDALALVIKAKELNLPMGTALDHCFIVNGKVGIDVHIAKAVLLSSKSITWERIESCVPIFSYTDKVNIFDHSELPSNYKIVSKISGNDAEISKLKSEGFYPVAIISKDNKPIVKDRITTYKFIRIVKLIDNSFKELIELSSFKLSDAYTAGLIDVNKPASPWVKYPNRMLDHRAWMNGARAIGDDLLLGMYSVDELLDINNRMYDITEDGTVIISD